VEVVSGDVGSLQLEIDYNYNVGGGSISVAPDGVAPAVSGLDYSVNPVTKKITIALASSSGLAIGTTKIADVTAYCRNSDRCSIGRISVNAYWNSNYIYRS